MLHERDEIEMLYYFTKFNNKEQIIDQAPTRFSSYFPNHSKLTFGLSARCDLQFNYNDFIN